MAKRRHNNTKIKLLILGVIGFTIICIVLGVAIPTMLVVFIIMAVVIIALAVVIAILNTPTMLGKRGERKIASMLNTLTLGENAYVINDVIVSTSDGGTSQIDHILFSKGGIFVIETKNYSGRIYGTDAHKDWIQVLAYGNTKNKFYNPVKQNQTHVYRLKEIIGRNYPVISCVVFLSADISNVNSQNVYSVRQLKRFLKQEAFKNNINDEELKIAYEKIFEFKKNPVQTKDEHIQEIKHASKMIDKFICPRCGGQLIIRHSQDGRMFYGCSNYPKCKFTKPKD